MENSSGLPMTPEEHYREAQRLVAHIQEAEVTEPTEFDWLARLAEIHAELAWIGRTLYEDPIPPGWGQGKWRDEGDKLVMPNPIDMVDMDDDRP